MPVIYYIEYEKILVLFQDNVKFEMIKNSLTYKEFQKIKSKYEFIDLLE